VTRRRVQLVLGVVIVAFGGYLVCSPELVRDVLHRRPVTSSDWINLRATFGGTVAGLGAFVAWVPAARPWLRTILGLLLCSMSGIGLARLIGFALDGHPDQRQYVWIVAELAIVIVSAVVLRRRSAA